MGISKLDSILGTGNEKETALFLNHLDAGGRGGTIPDAQAIAVPRNRSYLAGEFRVSRSQFRALGKGFRAKPEAGSRKEDCTSRSIQRRNSVVVQFAALEQRHSTPAPPAGENAGVRDDAFLNMGVRKGRLQRRP